MEGSFAVVNIVTEMDIRNDRYPGWEDEGVNAVELVAVVDKDVISSYKPSTLEA